MVTIYPTTPVITPATSATKPGTHQVVPTAKVNQRDASAGDRRFKFDRRRRRGSAPVMDRRTGAVRRRSNIDVSV